MKTLTSGLFLEMVTSGAHHLTNNHHRIDELNVYPVPDGDTGTNMKLTFNSGFQEIKDLDIPHVGQLAKRLSRGLLMGARGNSGVILSQIFRGFASSVQDKESLTGYDIACAFVEGKTYAYKAVMRPVEGTILSVLRVASDQTLAYAKQNKDLSVEDVFTFFLTEAKKALEDTPNQLKVLKDVGVVDSGGAGFVTIIEGFMKALEGQPVALIEHEQGHAASVQSQFEHDEFGYCTEFIIVLNEASQSTFNEAFFRRELEALGNSLVVVHDEDLVKVHVHTLTPGDALNLGQRYGEFKTLKIENMSVQHENLMDHDPNHLGQKHQVALKAAGSVKKPYAIISVCAGDGLRQYFEELKVDYVISGGQTMNPSTEDFVSAIGQLNADTIFILPNNSNVVMAANQVKHLVEDKRVEVLETKTLPQGLAACLAFNELVSVEDNLANMQEAMDHIISGNLTYSIKTTSIDGIDLEEGDFMGFLNRKLVVAQKSQEETLLALVEAMISQADDDYELLTIVVGDQAEADLDKVEALVESCSDLEVEIIQGDQPVYSYILGLE